MSRSLSKPAEHLVGVSVDVAPWMFLWLQTVGLENCTMSLLSTGAAPGSSLARI